MYEACTYTSLEISEELSRRQRRRVATAGHSDERFAVRRGDAVAPSAWGPPSDRFSYVVMCEVGTRSASCGLQRLQRVDCRDLRLILPRKGSLPMVHPLQVLDNLPHDR